MRQNLVAMLADLFNMLEVHPVKSVKYPGTGEYPPNEAYSQVHLGTVVLRL